jgi:hypothetical protein
VSLAVIVPYMYDRYMGLSTLLSNTPERLERVYEFKSHEIKFPDRIRNCEDVLLEEELGIAFLSCDPGRDRWNTVMVREIEDEVYHRYLTEVRERSTIPTPANHTRTTAPSGFTTTPTTPQRLSARSRSPIGPVRRTSIP